MFNKLVSMVKKSVVNPVKDGVEEFTEAWKAGIQLSKERHSRKAETEALLDRIENKEVSLIGFQLQRDKKPDNR